MKLGSTALNHQLGLNQLSKFGQHSNMQLMLTKVQIVIYRLILFFFVIYTVSN